jgi:hypothetical protein
VIVAKLVLAPAFVVGASLVARRFGARVGGLVGGLPVVAGPILLAITLVHGRQFGADSAKGTLLGLIALAAFVLVYAYACLRVGPVASVFLGWGGFLIADLVLSVVDVPAAVAFVATCLVFALTTAMLPAVPEGGSVAVDPPAWDLPVRALAAMVLVVAVTTASGALGPQWSGLLAPFPIITSVLAAFTHVQSGRRDTQLLLRGFMSGFYAFALFAFVLAVTLPTLGTAGSFGLALLAAVLLQVCVGVATARRAAPQPA